MKKLTKEDVADLVAGSSIYSTGGGFPARIHFRFFNQLLKAKKILRLAGTKDFSSNDFVCGTFGVGSTKDVDVDLTPAIKTSFSELQRVTGRKHKAIFAGEIGADALAFQAASILGLPVFDGDEAGGRAVPEIQHTTFNIKGLSILPVSIANLVGDNVVVTKASSLETPEIVARSMIQGLPSKVVSVSSHSSRVQDVSKTIAVGSLSRSMRLGNIVRAEKGNALDKILKFTKGKLIASGKITGIKRKSEKGFLWGETAIGQGKQQIKIWVKNENIVAFRNNRPIVTAPDLICVLNAKNCQGVHNNEMRQGMEVYVVAMPAVKQWLTKKGIDIMGPKSFGFKFNYKKF